jgi:hypothetical protein
MSKVDTDVYFNKDDVGKNLYRKKTYYTLVIEQDVIAKDKDEADNKFSDCGIDYSKIKKDITETKDGVETYMVDANYTETDDTKFIGKVKYDDDNFNQTFEEAVENEDIHIDTWADEDEPHQLTKIKLIEPSLNDLVKQKAESDVDIALNLEAESKIGK